MSDRESSPTTATSEPVCRTRTRSPNYPSMSLPEALSAVVKIWDSQHKHAAHVDAVLGLLGFTAMTGPAGRAIGALSQYALTKETGTGEGRMIALSDLALDYVLGDEQAKAHTARRSALKPPIYAHLWEKYGQFLPSDDTIQKHLIREKNFNPTVVADVVADYRATFEFAGLGRGTDADLKQPRRSVEVPGTPAVSHGPTGSAVTGDVTRAAPRHEPRGTPAPPPSGIRYLSVPLAIADVPIPVGMSEEDFDLLLATLNLWKRRIVTSEYPKAAVWKNRDTDMPVTIVGIAGEKDGRLFYQSSTGTGIPAHELEFQ